MGADLRPQHVDNSVDTPGGYAVASGLLRIVPASEAAEARRYHAADFAARYLNATGHALPVEDCLRWWPS